MYQCILWLVSTSYVVVDALSMDSCLWGFDWITVILTLLSWSVHIALAHVWQPQDVHRFDSRGECCK